MDRPLAKFRGASKRFGERVALADLDLDLYPGEVLGLLYTAAIVHHGEPK